MQELKIINKQEVLGKEFKMYGTFEEPLFLAKNVAEWIEHSDVSTMLRTVDQDEKLVQTLFASGQGREMWFLTENGLYEVLMQSRKPIAKQFKAKVKEILKSLRTGKIQLVPMTANQKRIADIKEQNVRIHKAQLLSKLALKYKDTAYSQVLDSYATKELTGDFLLPLPQIINKTYSAEEIGKLLGISANRVGRLSNKHNLKSKEYGEWFHDMTKKGKEIQSFRYYDNVLPILKSLVSVNA